MYEDTVAISFRVPGRFRNISRTFVIRSFYPISSVVSNASASGILEAGRSAVPVAKGSNQVGRSRGCPAERLRVLLVAAVGASRRGMGSRTCAPWAGTNRTRSCVTNSRCAAGRSPTRRKSFRAHAGRARRRKGRPRELSSWYLMMSLKISRIVRQMPEHHLVSGHTARHS